MSCASCISTSPSANGCFMSVPLLTERKNRCNGAVRHSNHPTNLRDHPIQVVWLAEERRIPAKHLGGRRYLGIAGTQDDGQVWPIVLDPLAQGIASHVAGHDDIGKDEIEGDGTRADYRNCLCGIIGFVDIETAASQEIG